MSKIFINIIAFNINGLGNKCLFSEFFEYVCSCDVFALVETHIENVNSDRWSKYFKNFNLFWKPATRVNNRGRAIAGCVYGVKKDLLKVGLKHSFKIINDTVAIVIQFNELNFNIYKRSQLDK